jgi:small GTP-binding protein
MTDLSDKPIKVILVGDQGVGKTNLINVSIGLMFNDKEQTTISSSFVIKKIKINDKTYSLPLWDTIGQEKYKHLTKLFFKESKIVILVYDKSHQETFKKIDFWFNEIKVVLNTDDIVLGIAANKDDIDPNEEDVNEEKAREYAKSINARFKLTSAKINANGFDNFLRELLIDYIKKCGGIVQEDDKRISLRKSHKKHKKHKFLKCLNKK